MTAGWKPTPNVVIPQSATVPECKTGRLFYVDGARLDKYSDPNGSEQKPYRTIQEAIDASTEYAFTGLEDLQMNVIYVMPGQYKEDLTIDRPIVIVGVNVLTCHIEGAILADTSYIHIADITFWDINLTNTTLFTLINCYFDNITITKCNGTLNNCEINNLYIYNSLVELFNNCKINETLFLQDDENNPRPGTATKSIIKMQDSKVESGVDTTYEVLNSGDLLVQVSHSLLAAGGTMVTGMTVNNFNATFLNFTKTLGTYVSYAGHPA